MHLFLAVGAECQQGHGTVGGATAGPGRHAVLRGLAGTLAAVLCTQAGGQILADLLPLGLLQVELARTLQVGRHLEAEDSKKETKMTLSEH